LNKAIKLIEVNFLRRIFIEIVIKKDIIILINKIGSELEKRKLKKKKREKNQENI
jgi:hypothetical protein